MNSVTAACVRLALALMDTVTVCCKEILMLSQFLFSVQSIIAYNFVALCHMQPRCAI